MTPTRVSIIDPTVPSPGPTLPANHPFSVGAFPYWSATTSVSLTSNAWIGSFRSGDVFTNPKPSTLPVWCVRGGRGGDAQ